MNLRSILVASGLALLTAATSGCLLNDSAACLWEWEGECRTDLFIEDETSFCHDGKRWVVREVKGEAEIRGAGTAWDDDDSGGRLLCCLEADVQHEFGDGRCNRGPPTPWFGVG